MAKKARGRSIERQTVRLLEVKPYPQNARMHSETQIDQIAALLGEYGQTQDIIVDDDMVILAGHGRRLAMLKLGWESVNVAILRGLTEAQKKGLRIADNKSAENATWDNDLLRFEVGELTKLGFDLSLLGFDGASLSWLKDGDLVMDGGGEWDGMPEFNQKDATAFRSIVVHFNDQKAIDQFAKVTKQVINDKTRFLWYPEIVIKPFVKYK